jgi:hypothetical protein
MGPLGEQERRMLHEAAERAMGTPAADALLRGLPPMDWREFATKSDLAVLRTELTLDFTTGMKALEDKLVDRFDTKIDGLDTKIGALDKKLDKKIAGLDATIRAQGRWQIGVTVTLFAALLTALPHMTQRTSPAPTSPVVASHPQETAPR